MGNNVLPTRMGEILCLAQAKVRQYKFEKNALEELEAYRFEAMLGRRGQATATRDQLFQPYGGVQPFRQTLEPVQQTRGWDKLNYIKGL